MRLSLLLTAFILLLSTLASAQPYVRGGEKRFYFAQTYLAFLPAWTAPGQATFLDPGTGQPVSTNITSRLVPRLAIGGFHFWGHADFYVSFPLAVAGYATDSTGHVMTRFSPGVETGLRLYPWRLEYGRVVPFVGVSWNVVSYMQSTGKGDGPTIWRHRAPLHGGVSWLSRAGRFDAGATWFPESSVEYPTSRTRHDPVRLPEWSAWLGYSFPFDATAMQEYAASEGLLELREREMEKRGALNSFAIAAGPSTALPLSGSTHNILDRPFLDDRVPSGIFPDLGIGYYHHNLDAAVNLSFRPIRQSSSGYHLTQELKRTALSLEAFKFIGDYHGFVPFVGLTFGREWQSVHETDSGRTVTDVSQEVWAPGIIAGWDIRPTRTESWLLRTNLRYSLGKLELPSGRDVAFDHLEINFIQLVVYPGRIFGSGDDEPGDE